ncbi:MAG TPA: nitroreductase/quinone reductase family protein [Candidatus Dormibacteraeota bacterium]|nr:nitroreductase/quinone reductase family protein [Candidatus Dormibacteraeota bacterium]
MSVEVTPRGTRGFKPPRLPGPIMAAITGGGLLAHRILGDRMRVQGRPLLLLHTVGARSGRTRTTMLGWFPDATDQGWLVVASFAGAARHPAWFLNLAANPDRVWVEIRGRKVRVRPASLTGADRADAWQRVVTLAPGYANYQLKTDREIPIVRLTPIEEAGS